MIRRFDCFCVHSRGCASIFCFFTLGALHVCLFIPNADIQIGAVKVSIVDPGDGFE